MLTFFVKSTSHIVIISFFKDNIMNWKEMIADIAPVLAGAVSGGNPLIVGLATSAVKKVLNLPTEATSEHIEKAIQSDPDAAIKLLQAQNDLKKTFSDNNIALESIYEKDRESARDMQKTNKSKTPDKITLWATINFTIVVIIVGILEYYGKLTNMTAMEASIVTLILRETFALVQSADNFWFGSSAGSRVKDDTIQNITNVN